ncbi:transcriptional regulator [Microvirga antarctica]|uniref:3'-5' exonuclease n=1 Tax=Microvirga antarctica TaxID=2819233 RepID=UPI001FE97918|nr:transcriptional regulator [Microvirga antarctica]
MARIAFVDFEASSLGKHGYPIEVAWVFRTGESASFLIRPEPAWTDWADDAEALHGLTRARLLAEGRPAGDVAAAMLAALEGHAIYATAPSWDGHWMSLLLRAGGLPRHALRLQDTQVAHRDLVVGILTAAGVPESLHETLLAELLPPDGKAADGESPPAHRALADARQEQRLWLALKSRAQEKAARFRMQA